MSYGKTPNPGMTDEHPRSCEDTPMGPPFNSQLNMVLVPQFGALIGITSKELGLRVPQEGKRLRVPALEVANEIRILRFFPP